MRILRRLILAVFVVLGANPASAYELDTHKLLTSASSEHSILASGFLERELAIEFDDTLLNPLVKGAADEDNFPRMANHFHDPVMSRPLSHSCSAPLRPVISATWAVDQSSLPAAERFDWMEARTGFLDALKAETRPARDAALVKTFETLGHIVHLIQDAAQPQHTRNDIHVSFNTFGLCGAPSIIEFTVEGEGLAANLDYRTAGKIPTFQRLTDYWVTSAPEMPGQGLTEYSNRNFITPGTNFKSLTQDNHYPDYPLPKLDLSPSKVKQEDIRDLLGSETPEGVTGTVTFYGNTVDDRLNGTVRENPFMTTFSLFDKDLLRVHRSPRFSYNKINVREGAKFLLPRAVLYSAGLLDFFFRGTLSAGIDESGTDLIAVVQNTSKESIASGSLTIYADLPSGERVPVSAPVNVTTVAAGDEFPDPIVLGEQASNATRFVAVYRGGLGQETPSERSPGAVIGKVFNAERVEEIFAGAQQWQIRTPRGVFVLPLRVDEWPTVKWGDADNMILAVAPLRANTAMPLVAYRLERIPESGDFVTDATGSVVSLTEVARTSFPLSETVTLATVNFSQVYKYRQQIGRYNVHWTETWIPTGTEANPFDGFYATTSYVPSGLAFESLHEATIPFAAKFAVNLDDAHNLNIGILRDPYTWRFIDFFVTAEGKILASVVVNPGLPPGSPVTVPVYMLNESEEKVPFRSQTRTIRPFFPAQIGPLLWALVSLTDSAVVASTAEPEINLSSTDLVEGPPYDNVIALACAVCPPALYRRMTHEYAGGPSAGTIESHEVAILHARSTQTDGLPQMTAETGQQAFGGSDLFRKDLRATLASEQFADFTIGVTGEQRVAWNFDCNTPFCTTDAGFAAFQAIGKTYGTPRPPAQPRTARRPPPTPNGERLIVLADSLQGGVRPLGKLAVWDHEAQTAKIALTIPNGFHSLAFVTTGRAVVWNDAPSGGTSGSYLVDLATPSGNGSKTAFFPLTDLRFGFTLLEADHLYNTSDLRFYRATPPLSAMRLPAVLAPVDGNPTGSYHIFKLR